MWQLRKLFLIILLLFISIIFYSKTPSKRQIIIYKAPLFLRPGLSVKKYIRLYDRRNRKRLTKYLAGGFIVNVIKEIKTKNNAVLLKFKYKNKVYYVNKKYTGRQPRDIRPGVAMPTGEEKLNKPLPFHYEPNDLKMINSFTLNGKKVYLRKDAAVAFLSMAMDAKKKGIDLKATLGYKSVGYYAKQYFYLTKIWGKKYLPRKLAFPGLSYKHTGVYVNVTTKQNRNLVDDHFFFTRAYKWLLDNSQYYGFHFLEYTNNLDYPVYCLRYTGRASLIFKVQHPPPYNILNLDKSVALKLLERKGLNITFLVIHDNENTATRAMKYALKKYGGSAIELVNLLRLNYRNLGISVDNSLIEIDPNRIFTDEDALRDMRMWNSKSKKRTRRKALMKVRKLRKDILNILKLQPKKYLIAIHSNKRYGRLSIRSFLKRSIRNDYYLYINRRMNKKSFFYVISKKDFNFFKRNKYNVVCPKKWDGKDGSLAFVAMRNNTPYITIETAEYNDKMEKKMLDMAVKLVKIRYRKWRNETE